VYIDVSCRGKVSRFFVFASMGAWELAGTGSRPSNSRMTTQARALGPLRSRICIVLRL